MVVGLLLVYVGHATSATWDEPHPMMGGYAIVTRHDDRLNAEVYPLMKMVAALPFWVGR